MARDTHKSLSNITIVEKSYRSLSLLKIRWKISIIILALIIVFVVLGYNLYKSSVYADIDTSVSHDENIFYVSSMGYNCKVCHMGYPNNMASESTGLFEEYRCVSCHINLDTTTTVVEAHTKSPHKSTGCTKCHDMVHFGHEEYNTVTKGFYGCRGRHQVVNQDLQPPQNPTVNFLITYAVSNYTGPESLEIDRIRWFYSNRYGGASFLTNYPYNFIDPYTGQADDIPTDKRYWVCLKCHFTKVGTRSNQNSTYWVTHPDKCYDCHKNTTGYQSSIFLLDPHAIRDGVLTPLNNCGVCHTGVNSTVASSIHSNVGCSCHSVIHISRYNSSASWVYLFYPGSGLYETPQTINLSRWLTIYHYDIYNTTTYNVSIYPIQLGQDILYSSIYYLLRDGDASLITGSNLRFLTCFNCHFVKDTGVVSPIRIQNPYSIPLPSESLKNVGDPHNITPLNGWRREPNTDNTYKILAIGMGISLIAILSVFITILRRRGVST